MNVAPAKGVCPMKRLWIAILSALLLLGCRSSQPTTNPFMRTTVPPPGTQGMMVMPGEAYPAGTAPPVVTPGVAAAPSPTTTVPVTPVPVQPAAVPVAPPPPPQKGQRFQPPGGDYLYHQSSNQPGPGVQAAPGVVLASN